MMARQASQPFYAAMNISSEAFVLNIRSLSRFRDFYSAVIYESTEKSIHP
jgi:hypothetical protein